MKRMLDHLGLDAALSAAGLLQPGSSRGYRPEQLITQFMLSILANTLHQLGGKHVSLLRTDSGLSDSAFLNCLEQRQIHDVISMQQNQAVQRALVGAQDWWVLHDEAGNPVPGIELNRFQYQASTWGKPRWVIGIRQHRGQRAEPKGKTLNLFADDPVIGKYRYSAQVTGLDLPAVTVWRIYRGWAGCKNRIKQLKYDFAADSFNMKDFWAMEAALNTVMLAYSLMSLMRQVLLKNSAVKHWSNTVQYTR